MATVDQLREQVRGEVFTPDEDGYEQARRVYNAMIDRHPAAVVSCVNVGDVRSAVGYAADNDLEIAVRGGAHSVPGFGTSDGGVVVDLSGMRGVHVDPRTRTARAEGGANWGDSTPRRTPSGSPRPGGSSRPPASPVSPSEAASGT
jgi:FAD/FMN-containing dehydrogenase